MFLAVDIDGHCDIDGPVHHDVIGADFDNDRIQIQDRIHRVEGPLLPGPQFGPRRPRLCALFSVASDRT